MGNYVLTTSKWAHTNSNTKYKQDSRKSHRDMCVAVKILVYEKGN
jgi:hypothetical protein